MSAAAVPPLPRLRSRRLLAGVAAVVWLHAGGAALAAQEEPALPEGLLLDAGSAAALPLGHVSAPGSAGLSLGLDIGGPSLPLARPAAPTGAIAGTAPESLGTRLTLGQPLGFEFLGGSVDWRAAATVETAPTGGEAYGLSLSLGSLADDTGGPPSDLRMGLTYGREAESNEQGILLDFSYSF